MGFFRPNYTNPGPGVDPDEPRKKGIKRFFEVLGRDFGDFLKLNLFYTLFMIVPLALFLLIYFANFPPILLVLSFGAAIPMGGVYCMMVYCITKKLRDDPEYIWYDMKRKFKEYFKQGIIPGLLYTALLFGQILFLMRMAAVDIVDVSFALLAFEAISLVLISMVLPYVFVQIAYVDLGLLQIFKNSLILAITNLPRSFMGAFSGNFLWLVFLLLFPISLTGVPILVLLAFSVSWLACLMWVWPSVDMQFNIETTIRERQEKKLEEKTDEESQHDSDDV